MSIYSIHLETTWENNFLIFCVTWPVKTYFQLWCNNAHHRPPCNGLSKTTSYVMHPIKSCFSSRCVRVFVCRRACVSSVLVGTQVPAVAVQRICAKPDTHGAHWSQRLPAGPTLFPPTSQRHTHTHIQRHTRTILPLSYTQKVLHWPLKFTSPLPHPKYTHLDTLRVGTCPSLGMSEL